MKQFFKTVFASTLGVLVALGIVTMGSIFFIIGVLTVLPSTNRIRIRCSNCLWMVSWSIRL